MNVLDLIVKSKKQKFLEQQQKAIYKKIFLDLRFNLIFDRIRNIANSDATFLSSRKELRVEVRDNFEEIKRIISDLSPWKKGPYYINDLEVESEWDSYLKFERIEKHLEVENKILLDLGCNNGYFMFQFYKKNPSFILGLDPIAKFYLQYLLFVSLIKSPTTNFSLDFSLLGYKELDYFESVFDNVLCLGILYHHQDPLGILKKIYKSLKRGGRVIVDVQGLATQEEVCHFPKAKYFGKENFYFLPSGEVLKSWMSKAKFKEVEIIYQGDLSKEEQRNDLLLNSNLLEFNSLASKEKYYPHRIYALAEK